MPSRIFPIRDAKVCAWLFVCLLACFLACCHCLLADCLSCFGYQGLKSRYNNLGSDADTGIILPAGDRAWCSGRPLGRAMGLTSVIPQPTQVVPLPIWFKGGGQSMGRRSPLGPSRGLRRGVGSCRSENMFFFLFSFALCCVFFCVRRGFAVVGVSGRCLD